MSDAHKASETHKPASTWHGRLTGLAMNHKTIGVTDWCTRERIANVLTSAPFVVLAHRFTSRGATPQVRQFGASLYGVGAAAVLYHGSSGPLRPHFRHIDYTAIAASAALLLRALRSVHGAAPAIAQTKGGIPFLSLVGAATVPLHPLASAAAHGLGCEALFWARAKRSAGDGGRLRRAHVSHLITSAVAGALFIGEEIVPEVPLIHAVWHMSAAAALAGFEAALPIS